jgi:hypothetical protein
MDSAELTGGTQIESQPAINLLHHRVRMPLQLLCAVIRELGDRRLCRVPVPIAVVIQIGGDPAQTSKGIAEHSR